MSSTRQGGAADDDAAGTTASGTDAVGADLTGADLTGADPVTRIWDVMRFLVLEQGDRRREVAETLGVSFFRAKALRRLLAGPQTMRDLTATLSTDKPYTTLVVDDLERRGYVARTVHPEDRRSKIVSLTPAGTAAAEQAERILNRPPGSLLALEPAELAELDRLMAKLGQPHC
ncbi:MarR family transcriptional regulator [Kitasatospora sp. NBC_01287]|uniref:MarR family winged helix-turn-helix transcriptional regulator n=1 Tax=Kitasatospora sp. NBC_01287 TaxID=2903573 RepID=UPI00225077EA|nr:MarR family transcriptional regulator [Kitasatospora sp. NBC_01287]MCX4751645.1 MarR family transcriptional regulator [Kitasatospora sp. NBC_01287]